MDRFAAMLILLGVLVSTLLIVVALFSMAPFISFCLVSLLYTLYLFMAYEESGVHFAQEFENRFWSLFACFLSAALFYVKDSPLSFGLRHPWLAFFFVLVCGYVMHLWDRHVHRISMSRPHLLRRNASHGNGTKGGGAAGGTGGNCHLTGSQSLLHLRDLGIPVEEQLQRINACLQQIDQLFIPSTVNNFINHRYVLTKEREIITIFEECDARALNYLISHVKLGLLIYKIKDHRILHGKHRTELVNLLAVERLPILSVFSRVIVLHSLQLLRLRANPQAEYWVRNIILQTHQDDLSELKTLTDGKGNHLCMSKLIFDDIRSETVRQDILRHIRREAAVLQTHLQMGTTPSQRRRYNTPVSDTNAHRPRRLHHVLKQGRKVLSDVDDTLYCSGGMYPAGVDKRFARKVVYPGVLAFYRELDLGTQGEEEWQDGQVGNLVFLSARPHVYKDMSEKANYAKFEKLRARGDDGRKGMHTMPSLLAGDLTSGSQFIMKNDFEPLARKKFDNFRRYVSIYPEYQHVFVCDNGQGDVRAGELMFDSFPYEFEALFVHVVMEPGKTYGYAPERWRQKEFQPYFFTTYPQAALYAAKKKMIRIQGLQRICLDAVKDFAQIKQFPSEQLKVERRLELNQAVWTANHYLQEQGVESVPLITAERKWFNGEKVRTPYGCAVVRGFDPINDLYQVDLDWRPIDVQLQEHEQRSKTGSIRPYVANTARSNPMQLETVAETDEGEEEHKSDEGDASVSSASAAANAQAGGESSAEQPEQTKQGIKRASSMPLPGSPKRTGLGLPTDESADRSGNDTDVCTDSNFYSRATVGGRFISKYTPPTLPKTDKSSSSIFTFLSPVPEEREKYKAGDQVQTPYGPAKVLEYRKKQSMVVVMMIGWNAKAYLSEDSLKHISKSLLSSFLSQFNREAPEPKPDHPFPEGTAVVTPFGAGTVTRAVSSPRKSRSVEPSKRPPTVGIKLHTWKLANGSHAMVYCTAETTKEWKEAESGDGTSFFSALGTLVTSSRTLLEPFLVQKPVVLHPKFKQYYKDGAAVSTAYGEGIVKSFREDDGFYTVDLNQWTMANGKHPTSILRQEDIGYRLAKGCKEGYPVLTNMGLSGRLASVEPQTGVHIVTIQSAGMVCYLQPNCVVRPLKAAVGEDVATAYGEGRVIRYDKEKDTYHIRLHGWNALLYAKGDTFEPAGDGIQDRDSPFGVNWLLQFLFFSSTDSVTGSGSRSRSNSLASGSISTRSVS